MYSTKELDNNISQIWLLYSNSYEYYYCLKQMKEYYKTEYSDSKSKVFKSHTIFEDDIFVNLNKILRNLDEGNKRNHDEIIRKSIEERNNI